MKVIIAGDYREYRDWCRETETPQRDAMFVERNEQLMGLELSPSDVVFVGRHWLNEVDRGLLASRIMKP